MTSLQELQRFITTPREDEHLEFKEAKNQFDLTKLFRYCVAIANEGGGKFILGVRACYQHCCLRYVMNNRLTNQSLRDRFKLSEDKTAIISQVIADAVEANLVKLDDSATTSRRYAKYLPFWA